MLVAHKDFAVPMADGYEKLCDLRRRCSMTMKQQMRTGGKLQEALDVQPAACQEQFQILVVIPSNEDQLALMGKRFDQ